MTFAEQITVKELEADPYPIYARLWREAPVAFVPAANVWFVTKWKDAEMVTKLPDFDIFRDRGAHAAFGFGEHFCAGKWFATTQIEIALRVLLEIFPKLSLVPGRPMEFRGWEFKAPTSRHVKLH